MTGDFDMTGGRIRRGALILLLAAVSVTAITAAIVAFDQLLHAENPNPFLVGGAAVAVLLVPLVGACLEWTPKDRRNHT